jgi:hypothetical protein
MPWGASDEFAPLDKIHSGDQSFDRRNICFGKQKVETDAQEDVGNQQEDENGHVPESFCVDGKDNRIASPCPLSES